MKILILGDSAAMHSGFAKVIREIFIPIYNTGDYEIEQIGWFHSEAIEEVPWKIYHTKMVNTSDGPKPTKDDKHGEITAPRVIESTKPDIIWTCGDPWMLSHMIGMKNNYNFKWISQVYIDGCVLHQFTDVWNYADALVPVTKFGYDILHELEGIDKDILCQPILAGVNKKTYRPFSAEAKAKLQAKVLSTSRDAYENPMLIGYVGRNQRRKYIPGFHILKSMVDKNMIRRCSACNMISAPNINYEYYFNKKPMFWHDRCHNCNSNKLKEERFELVFWLHCPPGDRGWRFSSLEDLWDVEGKVLRTNNHQVLRGIPEADFARVFNSFDVYLSLATEGFGLPPLEAMACGVPTITPEFAASQEFMKETGLCWQPKECLIEDGTSIPRPMPNYDSILNIIDKLRDPEFYKRQCENALRISDKYTWDTPVSQWINLLDRVYRSNKVVTEIY